jgi:hypothetical protein
VKASSIVHHRLYQQRLAGERPERPEQVVAWFGAMQGQEYVAAKWAIGLRCDDVTQSTIERAVAEGAIVRTWLMRGTLHLTAAADTRWLLGLLGPRVTARTAGRRRTLHIDDATLARSRELIIAALEGGRQLRRAEIRQILEDAGVPMDALRLYHVLQWTVLSGLICFGPMDDKQETLVLLDEWIPDGRVMERDEALAELARRYIRSHGPATSRDFAWWSGLTLTDARAGLAQGGPEIDEDTIDGVRYWVPADGVKREVPSPFAHLLPAFDEYYLGYQARDLVLSAEYDSRRVSDNGAFWPIIVIDGQVVGRWKQMIKKGKVILTLEPFRPLTEAEASAVAAAADRYSQYLELPVVLG